MKTVQRGQPAPAVTKYYVIGKSLSGQQRLLGTTATRAEADVLWGQYAFRETAYADVYIHCGVTPPACVAAPVVAPEPSTAYQKLLTVAGKLPDTFTTTELVIAVWCAYPDKFGLKDYEQQHPDNNKIVVLLSGNRGLVARGWLRREGSNLYSVNRKHPDVMAQLTTQQINRK